MGNVKDPEGVDDGHHSDNSSTSSEDGGGAAIVAPETSQTAPEPSAPPLSYGDAPDTGRQVTSPWGFPWDNFQRTYNGGLSSRGLVIARNVRLGFGRIHRVIADNLTLSCAIVDSAIVFGKVNVGLGQIKHLYCLPSTSINNGLSTVHHTTHLTEYQLRRMALEHANLPMPEPTPAQAGTSTITTAPTSNGEFPWGLTSNKVNLTMGHSDTVMAHTVKMGMAGATVCIARVCKLGIGTIRTAIVFDRLIVGAGSIRELFCLSSTKISGGLHRIKTIHYLSVDELTEFAARQGGATAR